LTFRYSLDYDGLLVAEIDNDLEVDFKACQGIIFGTENRKNNDLSAYVNRLVIEGKMSATTQSNIYQMLLGYENPGNNNNEAVCAEAYEALHGAGTYSND